MSNVVFLTTDTHATMVNDARLQTPEPGGPVDPGVTEVVTGPVATMTFAKEIDAGCDSGPLIAKNAQAAPTASLRSRWDQ